MSDSVTLVKALRIYDTQNSFATNVKISVGIQHNRPTSSQTTYNSKYPYHIHTGKPSYYSGSCTITYSNDDDDEEIDDCEQYVEEYIAELNDKCKPYKFVRIGEDSSDIEVLDSWGEDGDDCCDIIRAEVYTEIVEEYNE